VIQYTRESGVRQLEREVGRWRARSRARSRHRGGRPLTRDHRRRGAPLLGRPRVHPEKANVEHEVGTATGMYYTPMGGDIMFVEASCGR
jgi:ATP-dependent Lon protease